MNKLTVIAIDGPAASGKSTIGRMLAKALDYLFLDTGSMYRAVTLAALQKGIGIADEAAVTELSKTMEIDVEPVIDETDGRMYTVRINGVDVTWALRSPLVDAHVSQVSSYSGVRQEMVRHQRLLAQRGRIVMVGRDIGTVVFPEALLKLYITASPEERALRRWQERHRQGHMNNYEDILADVIRRDKIDSSREHSPLRAAEDAVFVDTTGRAPETIVEEILTINRSRLEPVK